MLHKYYIDINADTPELAYDEARSRPITDWVQVETGSIEPYDVQEIDTTNLE